MAQAPKAKDREDMCKGFIKEAFDKVWFQNYELKTLIHNSYLDNLDTLMTYAMENNIRLRDYFMGIKQELLKSPNTYERQK